MPDLRSGDRKPEGGTDAEEKVLGDKAVGGVDNDADHVPNVVSGLKGTLSNPNTSDKAKDAAEKKLDVLEK